ncbi:MAG: hypothetical protein RLZZ127_405 [Planctomycetota bacterium]|jgi:AraC-like DNA-binding protein
MAWTFHAPLPAPDDGPAGWRAWAAAVVAGVAADLADDRGDVRTAGGAATPPDGHFHHMPECFLQLDGRRRFRLPGAETVLAPGEALLIPPLLRHHEAVIGRDPGVNLVLSVQTGWLSVHAGRVVRGTLQPHGAQAVPAPGHALGDGCLRCAAAAADDAGRRLWLRAFLDWAGATLREAPLPAPGRHARVGRALALVQYELGRSDLGVAFLARTLGCTPGHLTRQFREDLGEAPLAYIRRARLERARDLLRDHGLPVAAAARLVGIRDAAYFSRIYRARFGAPPSATR